MRILQVRRSYWALALTKSAKSALSAFFMSILLLGLYSPLGQAQTRLDSSQVIPLQGTVQGPFAATKLRDFNSAADHGNGTTNGIVSAIADCGVSISCSILVPPSYGLGEPLPGYGLSQTGPTPGALIPSNISLFDHRYGDARMSVNNLGFGVGFIHTPTGWLYNYYQKARQNATYSGFVLRQLSLDGGTSLQSKALNYSDKTKWAAEMTQSISHTPGQHVSTAIEAEGASVGDSMLIRNRVTCFGGYTAEGDLGCRAVDNTVAQGNVEYSGPLTGSASTGANTVTVAPTQGAGTQGGNRFLARTSAGTISIGTIAQVSNGYNTTNVTGAGTSWPVSTVIGRLGTDVTLPGAATVTPTGFSVGSMAAIQTSSLVCVSDQESFEMVYPTAVTATTFTASFYTVHVNDAVISVGGLCGYLMDFTADDVVDATYPAKTQTITGTLHFAWPVKSSTSATAAALWVAGNGFYQGLPTRFNSSNANGYVLYPFATVQSTQVAGGLSDTLALGPNNVAWTVGDVVSEFMYPAFHDLYGNSLIEGYYPNIAGSNGFALTYNAPLQGSDSMMSMKNSGTANIYNSHGGNFYPPHGIHLQGLAAHGITLDRQADNAALSVGCALPCTAIKQIIGVANANYYDFLVYDEVNRNWAFTANVGSTYYAPTMSRFVTPFNNTFIAQDSASAGYVNASSLRSNSPANSDVAGELQFSNVSSATQSLHGTYGSHPECLARPQFDTGTSNRHWVSYAARSFTVNFANPVSGTVSYWCVARN